MLLREVGSGSPPGWKERERHFKKGKREPEQERAQEVPRGRACEEVGDAEEEW